MYARRTRYHTARGGSGRRGSPGSGGGADRPDDRPDGVDQLQAFLGMQSRVAQLEADNKCAEDASKAEMVAVLAKKGETDNALALLRKQSDDAMAAERGQRRARRNAPSGTRWTASCLASLRPSR